jgi:hypothetical protein
VQMPQISNDLAAANTVTTRTAANTLQPTHAAVKK